MAGGAPDALDLLFPGHDLGGDLFCVLGEHRRRRDLAGEAALAFIGRWIRLQPDTEHGPEHRRFQRRAMEQRRLDAAEGLENWRSHARPFLLLVMAVVTL